MTALPLRRPLPALAVLALALALAACSSGSKSAPVAAGPGSTTTTIEPATTAVEKAKPAPGTGNVQGAVRFDDQPVAGIEVKLCEVFARFGGGCSGAQLTTRTEADGSYVIKNVPPKTYQGLLVRVFDTNESIFAGAGVVGAKSYDVVADKTLFVDTTHLFKSDVKLTAPPAGGSTSGASITLTWDAYPGAARYQVSMFNNDTSIISTDLPTNKKVDGTSFTIAKPVPAGEYRWQVEAFNAKGRKIAESPDGIEFTVTA